MADSDNRNEMTPQRSGMFRDSAGGLSSKRIAGFLILCVGAVYLMIIGAISIERVVADSTTALDVGRTLIYTGAGLIGVGVAEKFGGKR